MEKKTVLLTDYVFGLYPGWESYSYSEYGYDGIPKFAEIRRIKNVF